MRVRVNRSQSIQKCTGLLLLLSRAANTIRANTTRPSLNSCARFIFFSQKNNLFAQRDISIDMGVDDVDETAIMAVDNVEVLDSAINETADMEYEMEMYCQADDGAG